MSSEFETCRRVSGRWVSRRIVHTFVHRDTFVMDEVNLRDADHFSRSRMESTCSHQVRELGRFAKLLG